MIFPLPAIGIAGGSRQAAANNGFKHRARRIWAEARPQRPTSSKIIFSITSLLLTSFGSSRFGAVQAKKEKTRGRRKPARIEYVWQGRRVYREPSTLNQS
jgi:hypothetical protein